MHREAKELAQCRTARQEWSLDLNVSICLQLHPFTASQGRGFCFIMDSIQKRGKLVLGVAGW